MHRALRIQEILLTIFSHWQPSDGPNYYQSTDILAALARTCRSFKDVALNILWSELLDLTPLPRCIPEACGVHHDSRELWYSFERRLNEKEWATLLSYTRRIRHIHGNSDAEVLFENDSLVMICRSPAGPPLFPNLRTLYWESTTMIPAMQVAVPSLTTLDLELRRTDRSDLNDFLGTISDLCRNLNRVHIHVSSRDLGDIICNHIRRLACIRRLELEAIAIDADMIACLSETPALEYLSIRLRDKEVPPFLLHSRSACVFPALAHLCMASESQVPEVTNILSCMQLPALKDLVVDFMSLPLTKTLESFMSTIQKVCSSDSLTSLKIYGRDYRYSNMPSGDRLSFEDLRPCMAFAHLCCLVINLRHWTIALTDNDMLALVSAWPHLHTFSINDDYGWRNDGGITFRSLVRILNMRRPLVRLSLAIYTASHVDLPLAHEIKYLPLDPSFRVDFVDSRIQSHEVPGCVNAIQKLGLQNAFVVWSASWAMWRADSTADSYRRIWDLVKRGLIEGGFRAS